MLPDYAAVSLVSESIRLAGSCCGCPTWSGGRTAVPVLDHSNSCCRLYRTIVQGSAATEEMQETAAPGFPRLQAYFTKSLIASGQSSREAGQVRSPTMI